MIIADKNKRRMIEITDIVRLYDGDREQLVSFLQKSYTRQRISSPNTYMARFLVSKLIPGTDMKIISPIHQKIFTFSWEFTEIIGMKRIFGRLFARSKLSIQLLESLCNKNRYTVRGDNEYATYKHEEIKSFMDLIMWSITTTSEKDGEYWKSVSVTSMQRLREQHDKRSFSETIGNGISRERGLAEQKSLSEVLERLASGYIPQGSKKNKGIDLADDLISIYYDSTENLPEGNHYYPVERVGDGKFFLVPGDVLFYPYVKIRGWNGNSNGVSCHINEEKAYENALFEIIERDAFVMRWILKKGATHIIPNKTTKKLMDKISGGLYELDLFVLEFDNPIPVIMSLARKRERVMVSLGTGHTWQEAVEKTLFETAQFVGHHIDLPSDILPEDSVIERHIKRYLQERHYTDISWVYDAESSEEILIQDRYKMYMHAHQISSDLKKQGTELFLFRYTLPELQTRERVALRVLSTGHLPIRFGKKTPKSILNSKRIKYWQDYFKVDLVNTAVHPFG